MNGFSAYLYVGLLKKTYFLDCDLDWILCTLKLRYGQPNFVMSKALLDICCDSQQSKFLDYVRTFSALETSCLYGRSTDYAIQYTVTQTQQRIVDGLICTGVLCLRDWQWSKVSLRCYFALHQVGSTSSYKRLYLKSFWQASWIICFVLLSFL